MAKKRQYKILAFTWNTESVRLCESMDPMVCNEHRITVPYTNGLIPSSNWLYNCEIPDFVDQLKKLIINNNIDIVSIGFQEDAYPGSYFHSDLLPNEIMPSIGYRLIKRNKTIGFGKTTVKSLINGTFTERGLRMSIYVKDTLYNKIIEAERAFSEYEIKDYYYIYGGFTTENLSIFNMKSLLNETIAGKGGINSNLYIPDVGWISFIDAHLPFNAESLVTSKRNQDPMIRQDAIMSQNECFNMIVRELILNEDYQTLYKNYNKITPQFAIIMGDLNYRICHPDNASVIADRFLNDLGNPQKTIIREYLPYDEFRIQMEKGNIYKFSEGPQNSGPLFEPTAKMVQGRPDFKKGDSGSIYWKTGKWDQRIPSWCDRILYQNFGPSSYNLVCETYDRFDVGQTIKLSDHSAVYAIFNLINSE